MLIFFLAVFLVALARIVPGGPFTWAFGANRDAKIASPIICALIIGACCGASTPAWADGAVPSASPSVAVPAASPTPASPPDEVDRWSGRVYAQGGYLNNLNHPNPEINDYHQFDYRANALTLDALQVLLEKEPTFDQPVGFRVNVIGGQIARVVHANGLGSEASQVDLFEGLLRFKAPLGNGLDIDVGKFIATQGFENPMAIDNFNYSTGLMYNFLNPNTLTGLHLRYPFSERLETHLYATNAWDSFSNRNRGFTYGFGLYYTFDEKWTANVNTLIGPQQFGNSRNLRAMYDVVVTFEPDKDTQIVGEIDYGNESDVPGLVPGNAHWNAAGLWFRRQITPTFALALRPEFVNDSTGALTGTPQVLKAITFTPEIKMGDFIVRPEIRRDWSNARSFDTGTRKGQTIIGIGVMYQHPFSWR